MTAIEEVRDAYAKVFVDPLFKLMSKGLKYKLLILTIVFASYFFIFKWFLIPNISCWILMIGVALFPSHPKASEYSLDIGITLFLIGIGYTAIFVFALLTYILYRILKQYETNKLIKYADKTPEELANLSEPEITIHIRGDET